MLKRILLLVLIVPLCCISGSATSKDTLHQKSLQVDLLPFYYVFFDVRKQVRLAFEFQNGTEKQHFPGIHVDAGLYDDYSYYKYYDFFNQSGGLYSVREDVKTYGCHLLPSWNVRLSVPGSVKRTKFLVGTTADINIFEKKLKTFNSRTQERTSDIQRQARMGLGVHTAMTYRLFPSVHAELKCIFIARILTLQSENGMKNIKPFKSVWFDEKQNFWLIPQVNIAYDF